MRARPREINIFNMSLLDILCGALGAFCFMMLVALPYYVTGGDKARQQNQESIAILLQDVTKLRERMTDPAVAEELRQLIDRLEAEIKRLEGQVNQLGYDNRKLRSDNEAAAKALNDMNDKLDKAEAENETLQQENLETKQALAAKKPFAVMAATRAEGANRSQPQAVDLYLERTRFVALAGKFERFNPSLPGHMSAIPDDVIVWALENGVNVWVNANSAPGDGYRVYVKFLGLYQTVPPDTTTVALNFFGAFDDKNTSATVALNSARPWALV